MTVGDESGRVYDRVDIHVAVISTPDHNLAGRELPTRSAGYKRALAFIEGHGDPVAIGIEGTSSYGVGITSAAVAECLLAVEVIRPGRAERCRLGKSDPIDAYQAARAALGNHHIAPAKDAAALEGIRGLHNARYSAMKGPHVGDGADPRVAHHRTDSDPGEVPRHDEGAHPANDLRRRP